MNEPITTVWKVHRGPSGVLVAHCEQLELSVEEDDLPGLMQSVSVAQRLFFDICEEDEDLVETLAGLGWPTEEIERVIKSGTTRAFQIPFSVMQTEVLRR